jgi:DNA helicase-2/ATP-dependent DNA helicase PcrA
LGRLRREGWAMKDVAILYRSHFHAMEIQLELARHRVPYVITSGIRFFEQAHVKDACCVLRLLANPGDELAFVRLLELLPRVGHRTALKIWARLGHRLDVASKEAHQEVVSLLPAPAREGWAKIAKAFEPSAAGGGPVSMADTLATFLNEFYDGYAVEVFDNYQRRLEDIEELVDYTSRFDSVEDFLSEVALATNLDADGETLAADHADAVRLTTVHQAKGLEWGVVFILWMSDGMFPSARAVGEGGEGEERRLFYVATTRAKDALYLCMPSCRRSRDGNTTFYMRSRFITELPPNLLTE